MAKSFSERIEQILYAGMKPHDPFYLTNRPFRKKLLVAAGVIVPFIAIGVLVALSGSGYFARKTPAVALAPVDTAQALVPDLNKVKVPTQSEIQVIEIHFDRGDHPSISGTLKNNTKRTIHSGEVIFDLGNDSGAQVGRFTTRLSELAPESIMNFQAPLNQPDAAFALVREVIIK